MATICTVKGRMFDAGNNALRGQWKVDLVAPLLDRSTTPDTLYLSQPRVFTTAVDGTFAIPLAESNTSQIPYEFLFFGYIETISGIDYYTAESIFDFQAIVPNQAEVEIGEILPSGFNRDQLQTSIRQIKSLVLADIGNATAAVPGVVRVDTPAVGTSSIVYVKNSVDNLLANKPETFFALKDVDVASFANGEFVQYNATTGKLVGSTPSGGGSGSIDQATTTTPGLVKITATDANPVVYTSTVADGKFALKGNNTDITALNNVVDITVGNNAIINSASVQTLAITSNGTAPTPSTSDSSSKIATTGFVTAYSGLQDTRFKSLVHGRLSLSSTSNEADVTSSTTIYFNPCLPDRPEQINDKGVIGLYVSGAWKIVEFQAASLSLSGLASGTAFDIFAELNTSTGLLVLTTRQWTNISTRVALYSQDGILVHSSANPERRYIGSFFTSGTGAAADSVGVRYVWNFYNRIQKRVYALNTASGLTYVYNTAAWTQATYTPTVFIFSGWPTNFIDLRYLPPTVYCNVAGGGASVSEYLAVFVNNSATSTQLAGQPLLFTTSTYMTPAVVDLTNYSFGLGKYLFKGDMFSFTPTSGGSVTFVPLNSYIAGYYAC